MNIEILTEKYRDMSLYTFNIDPEMVFEVVKSMSKVLNSNFNTDELFNAIKCNNKRGFGQVYISFGNTDKREFIIVDCIKTSEFFVVITRCLTERSAQLLKSIEPWRTNTFESLGYLVPSRPKDLYAFPEFIINENGKTENDPIKFLLENHELI